MKSNEMYEYKNKNMIISGSGSPDGAVSADKGTLYIDNTTPNLYMNTDGATAWELVGLQA